MNFDLDDADSAFGALRWSVQQRLQFIDFRLFWDARVNRRDLVDRFDISPQQATADLERYNELAPGNARYDASSRTYARGDTYEPAFTAGQANRFLLQLQAIGSGMLDQRQTWFGDLPSVEVLAVKHRAVDEGFLARLVDAIREGRAMEVTYHSTSGKPPEPRVVEPHALVYSDTRWHFRAWSRANGAFRDFNLNRCDWTSDAGARTVDPLLDYQWQMTARMRLAADPALTKHKAETVRRDYNFVDDECVIETRLALLFYVKAQLRLDVAELLPEARQLVLLNADELDEEERAASKMSSMAVARSRQ